MVTCTTPPFRAAVRLNSGVRPQGSTRLFDELVKTVRLHLSERLTSPLMGAFVVSWCAWNYRALLVVFSSEEVLAKIFIIDHYLYPNSETAILLGFAAPLATASLYLFVYPFPAKWVYAFTRMRQREILEIRRKIEDETPLTQEDSKRIRNQLIRAETDYFIELDRKNTEIARLKSQLSELQTPSGQATTAPSDDPDHDQLNPELIRMLELIDKQGGKIREEVAIKKSGVPKIETEYLLGELRQLELASRVYDSSEGDHVFKFTHKGRTALLNSRKSPEV